MALHNSEAARANYDAVLNSPPDPSAAYVALSNRGVLAMYRQDWDSAIADLKKAIHLKPDELAAPINLALTHRQRAEQLPAPQCALLLAPQGVYPLLAVRAQHEGGGWEGAVAVLDEAVRRRQKIARLYHERGRLHVLLEDERRAREDFGRAIALAPNIGSVSTLADDLIQLGRLLHRSREHAKAARCYAAVLRIQPRRL